LGDGKGGNDRGKATEGRVPSSVSRTKKGRFAGTQSEIREAIVMEAGSKKKEEKGTQAMEPRCKTSQDEGQPYIGGMGRGIERIRGGGKNLKGACPVLNKFWVAEN